MKDFAPEPVHSLYFARERGPLVALDQPDHPQPSFHRASDQSCDKD
jgi:hypothetical protein